MPTPSGPRRSEHPSTYVIQDRKNEKELTRLTIQDHLVTTAMGGVLPEQADPTVFHRVLDVGCGPGGWIIETAKTYPTMSLVGIDISQRMIKYARTQAEAHQINDRIEFHVMDALRTLEFPAASFDLVNLRFGISYLRTWDWPKILNELLRVTRPGGVVRVTDSETVQPSNSPALKRLFEMGQCALYRAGHLFTQETTGLTAHLPQLLNQQGCEQVQVKAYAIVYQAGTLEGQAHYEDLMLMFQTARPFIEKWGCAARDYGAVYRQALDEMRQSDFYATWNLFTAWGVASPNQNHNSSNNNWSNSL
jgi:ubiquinone/menaquinone biosynthesis C-methylase UbiE